MKGKILGIAFIIMLITLPIMTGVAVLGDPIDNDWHPAKVHQPMGDPIDNDWHPATITNPLGDPIDNDWHPA